MHNDPELARTTQSFNGSPSGVPPVAIVSASSISRASVEAALPELGIRLTSIAQEREGSIRRRIEKYKQFFGSYGYPVERQFATFLKKGALPSNAIPALLLSLELKSGALFGVHDLSRISGQIVFDTASADESFLGISGKPVSCSAGELIVRDGQGIIASIFQGPDRRTAASFADPAAMLSWAWLVFGYPSMPTEEFELLLEDAKEMMTSIHATDVVLWRGVASTAP